VAQKAVAAIGAQQSFDGDLVSGAGFGDVGARRLQSGGAAVRHEIEVQLDAFDLRRLVRVLEDAAEVFADGERNPVGRRRGAISRSVHILHAEIGVAQNRDAALEAIGRVFAVFVHA